MTTVQVGDIVELRDFRGDWRQFPVHTLHDNGFHCVTAKSPSGSDLISTRTFAEEGENWRIVATQRSMRAVRIDLSTSVEAALRDAMKAIEDAGCSPVLTEALTHVSDALELVGRYVDRQLRAALELEPR